MKNLSFLLLLSMALVAVSCGGKDDGGSSSSNKHFSSDPYKVSTVNGLINVDNYVVTAGGQTYQLTQQGIQIATQAMIIASQQNPPIPLNNARQLKARITGSLYNANAQGGYNTGYTQPGYGNVLNVTQMVIYR